MEISKIIHDPEIYIGNIVEVDGILHCDKNSNTVFLTSNVPSEKIILAYDFWTFYSLTRNILTDIGETALRHQTLVSVSGNLNFHPQLPDIFLITKITNIRATISFKEEFHKICQCQVNYEAHIDYSSSDTENYPAHSHVQSKLTFNFNTSNDDVFIPLLEETELSQFLHKPVVVFGKLKSESRLEIGDDNVVELSDGFCVINAQYQPPQIYVLSNVAFALLSVFLFADDKDDYPQKITINGVLQHQQLVHKIPRQELLVDIFGIKEMTRIIVEESYFVDTSGEFTLRN
jgi:hypothetical protein